MFVCCFFFRVIVRVGSGKKKKEKRNEGVDPQIDLSSTIIVSRDYNDLGVVPQIDLSSTIIVSRDYNDINLFLPLTACPSLVAVRSTVIKIALWNDPWSCYCCYC